jgi:hypothetical protein
VEGGVRGGKAGRGEGERWEGGKAGRREGGKAKRWQVEGGKVVRQEGRKGKTKRKRRGHILEVRDPIVNRSSVEDTPKPSKERGNIHNHVPYNRLRNSLQN